MSSKNNRTGNQNIIVNYDLFPTLELVSGNGYLTFEAAKKKLIEKLQESKGTLVVLENENQIINEFNIKIKDIDSYYDKIVANLQQFVDTINDKINSVKEEPKIIEKKEQDKASHGFFSSYLHKNTLTQKYREKDRKKAIGVITQKGNAKLVEFFKKQRSKQPNCYSEEKNQKKINKIKLKGFFSSTFTDEIKSNNCVEVYKILLKDIENCASQLKLILKKYAEIILNTSTDINDEIIINYKLLDKSTSQHQYGGKKYIKTSKKNQTSLKKKTLKKKH